MNLEYDGNIRVFFIKNDKILLVIYFYKSEYFI